MGQPHRVSAHPMCLMPEGTAFLAALRSRLQWGISTEMAYTGWIARSTYLLLVFFLKSSLRCVSANSGKNYGTGGIVSAGISCEQQLMDSLAGFSIPDQLPLVHWLWSGLTTLTGKILFFSRTPRRGTTMSASHYLSIIGRLEVFDRRTCEVVREVGYESYL